MLLPEVTPEQKSEVVLNIELLVTWALSSLSQCGAGHQSLQQKWFWGAKKQESVPPTQHKINDGVLTTSLTG